MERDGLRVEIRSTCDDPDHVHPEYRPVTDADLASLGYVKLDLPHVQRMISNGELHDLEAYFDTERTNAR